MIGKISLDKKHSVYTIIQTYQVAHLAFWKTRLKLLGVGQEFCPSLLNHY